MDFTEILRAIDAPIGCVVLFMVAKIRSDLKAMHKRLNRIENKLWPEDNDRTPSAGHGITAACALIYVGIATLCIVHP